MKAQKKVHRTINRIPISLTFLEQNNFLSSKVEDNSDTLFSLVQPRTLKIK